MVGAGQDTERRESELVAGRERHIQHSLSSTVSSRPGAAAVPRLLAAGAGHSRRRVLPLRDAGTAQRWPAPLLEADVRAVLSCTTYLRTYIPI